MKSTLMRAVRLSALKPLLHESSIRQPSSLYSICHYAKSDSQFLRWPYRLLCARHPVVGLLL